MSTTDTSATPVPQRIETPGARPGPRSSTQPGIARARRVARGVRAYTLLGALAGLFVVLVVLAAANTETAKLDWVFGSTNASLLWIILAAGLAGWLLGITTALFVSHRTRRAN